MRKKKTDRRKIKDRLDKLVKKYIKIRDNFTCQHCNKMVQGVNCHGSHIIPVSADGRLAFDPENIKVLCFHCHRNFWHLNPTGSGVWFAAKFPERLASLKAKHLTNKTKGTIKMYEYEEMEEEIKALLKSQETNQTTGEY